MHGFDGGQILVHDVVNIPAPLFDIPYHPAQNTLVCICFYIDLNIQKIPDAFVRQKQDSFCQDDSFWFDVKRLIRTVVTAVIVDRTIDGLSVFEHMQMIQQKLSLQRIRMVIIYFFTVLERYFILSAVVVVMINDSHIVLEFLLQPPGEGGFSGTGPSGNSNNDTVHICPFLCAVISSVHMFYFTTFLQKIPYKNKISGLHISQSADSFGDGYPIVTRTLVTAPNPNPEPIFLFVVESHPVNSIAHKHKTNIFLIISPSYGQFPETALY